MLKLVVKWPMADLFLALRDVTFIASVRPFATTVKIKVNNQLASRSKLKSTINLLQGQQSSHFITMKYTVKLF